MRRTWTRLARGLHVSSCGRYRITKVETHWRVTSPYGICGYCGSLAIAKHFVSVLVEKKPDPFIPIEVLEGAILDLPGWLIRLDLLASSLVPFDAKAAAEVEKACWALANALRYQGDLRPFGLDRDDLTRITEDFRKNLKKIRDKVLATIK